MCARVCVSGCSFLPPFLSQSVFVVFSSLYHLTQNIPLFWIAYIDSITLISLPYFPFDFFALFFFSSDFIFLTIDIRHGKATHGTA